jgi:hypothetical protein
MQFVEPSLQPHSYFGISYFFGGAFLVNAIPHFVQGVSGRSFPTPFASPPGKGLSSPMANVLWGTANAVVGYFLVCWVGVFQIRRIPDVLVMGAGGLVMALGQLELAAEAVNRKSIGPVYSDFGRMSRPSRSCSRQCAVHPRTRAVANIGEKSSLGILRPCRSKAV